MGMVVILILLMVFAHLPWWAAIIIFLFYVHVKRGPGG